MKGNEVGVFHNRKNLPMNFNGTPDEDGYSVMAQNLLKENMGSNMMTSQSGPTGEQAGATAGIYGGGFTHAFQGGSGSNLLRTFDQNAKNWRVDATTQERTDVAQSNGWRNEVNGPSHMPTASNSTIRRSPQTRLST